MNTVLSAKRRVLVAAILASSMGFIDGSVLSIMTPSIRTSFDASLATAQWVSNAYLLPLSALILLGGATGDRFGLRNTFAAGIAVFVGASLLAAFAPTAELLIAARAFQGFGAAFMVPGSLAMIAETFPEAERGKAIGTWAAASSLTTLLGPLLGGLFLSWLGDAALRWIFAINLPLGAASLILLRGAPPRSVGSTQKPDIVGAILISLALGLISFAFIGGTGHVLLEMILGGLALTAFVAWEAKWSAPMLPLGLFRNLRFSGAQLVTFLIYFALTAVSFYLPSVLISGWGASPLEASAVLLPYSLALTVLSRSAGRLADRFGPAPVIATGGLLVSVSMLVFAVSAPAHLLWTGAVPLMALFGVGMSGVAGPISTAVMGAVQPGNTGVASATNNAVARMAGLLAVAAMGSLAASVFSMIAGPETHDFGLVVETALSPEMASLRVAATDAAFAAVCYCAAGFSALGAILAWFMLEHKTPLAAQPTQPIRP
ncbi:MFS transporter [Devosia sp. XJ19-1]|uniref:MFS transporter n=1 Tax=Devosia ureilytica TaxID=2952754 RepID=A0A9Q4AR37_9HYPH|nr:MFS transporter [Devosia ureilytica]MCP8884713.1 MFS transporter [Devosia ureilytica]MCP8888344.1 MFS transporter [Devosia ureilytica]